MEPTLAPRLRRTFALVLLVALFALSAGCGNSPAGADAAVVRPPDGSATIDASLGSSGVIVNLLPSRTDFTKLTPWPEGIGYLRVWGGSRGMATYPSLSAVPAVIADTPSRYSIVTQTEIDQVVALQNAHDLRVIYMVNVNDTLDSQVAFIEKLVADGVNLSMLELGNELYLTKFTNGDTDQLGVARAWSAAQYVALVDAWRAPLAAFAVPVYVLAASHGGTDSASDLARQAWNNAVLAAFDSNPNFADGVTFHRYAGEARTGNSPEEEISNASFDFLHTFGEVPIAITESGYEFDEATEENLELAAGFWTAFRAALKATDLYGIHVTYSPEAMLAGQTYALFTENGITPVGTRFTAWLASGQ